MATKKVTKKKYTVSAKLVIEVAKVVEVESLAEAVSKAETLKVHDFVNLKALEVWDYEKPEIRGVFIA